MQHLTSQLQPASKEDLYDISLKSSFAESKEVYIFEMGSMSDLFDEAEAEAEKLRSNFLDNKIRVKQITNSSTLPKFSENDRFINEVMSFRYVPEDIFSIHHEILIFDDTVAIYNPEKLLIIEDKAFATNQKQLFMSIWNEGESPKLGFAYKPNHSFYNNLNYFLDETQIIVWPDADAKESYKDLDKEQLGDYIKSVISLDPEYYSDASYIIVFIWSMEGDKMMDAWKFNENHVDDRSGPLGDIRVYRETAICDNLGLASGNTLLVLGYEEKMRRQSTSLQAYLDGPVPKLPLEMMNNIDFFAK